MDICLFELGALSARVRSKLPSCHCAFWSSFIHFLALHQPNGVSRCDGVNAQSTDYAAAKTPVSIELITS